jgi:hypothetical protein
MVIILMIKNQCSQRGNNKTEVVFNSTGEYYRWMNDAGKIKTFKPSTLKEKIKYWLLSTGRVRQIQAYGQGNSLWLQPQ